MRKTIQGIILGISLISCVGNSEKHTISYFYPIDSLLNSQVEYLSTSNVGLLKGTSDSTMLKIIAEFDTTFWKEELKIFYSLNLNKPALIDRYEVDTLQDTYSNLNILLYKAIDSQKEVQELKYYYLNSLQDIKKIEGKLSSINLVYKSATNLQMSYKKLDGKAILDTYSIRAGQKLTLRDSIEFYLAGKIETK